MMRRGSRGPRLAASLWSAVALVSLAVPSAREEIVGDVRLLVQFSESPHPHHDPAWRRQTAELAVRADRPVEVVMLGDSITAGGDWAVLLGRDDVANHGIGGDTALGLAHRVDYVTGLTPRVCFVQVGFNDVARGTRLEETVEAYQRVVDRLRGAGVTPVVQSTPLTGAAYGGHLIANRRIARLNEALEEYARDAGVMFLDLNARLARGGELAAEYTADGVHLTPPGYRQWATAVADVLNGHR